MIAREEMLDLAFWYERSESQSGVEAAKIIQEISHIESGEIFNEDIAYDRLVSLERASNNSYSDSSLALVRSMFN